MSPPSRELREMENMMKEKRHTLIDNQILEELEKWVKDLVYSHTYETKFFRVTRTHQLVIEMII